MYSFQTSDFDPPSKPHRNRLLYRLAQPLFNFPNQRLMQVLTFTGKTDAHYSGFPIAKKP